MKNRINSGLLFVLPLTVFLFVMTFAPILYVIGLSLFRDYLPDRHVSFVGIKNFITILTKGDFWISLKNTAVYVVFSVFFHLLVAVVLAVMLDRNRGRFVGYSRFVRSLLIVPWLLSWAVAAALWKLILDPAGVLNAYLIKLGIMHHQIAWFGTTSFAMAWIIGITVWKAFPFYLMLVYAALTTIPPELYESADIDGAPLIRQVRSITLPMISPTMLTLAVLDVIWSLRQFDIIYLTTGGGPLNSTRTLTLQVYFTAYENFRFGISASDGVLILLISTVLAIIYIRLYERVEA